MGSNTTKLVLLFLVLAVVLLPAGQPVNAQCEYDLLWDFNGGVLGEWTQAGYGAHGDAMVWESGTAWSTLTTAEILTRLELPGGWQIVARGISFRGVYDTNLGGYMQARIVSSSSSLVSTYNGRGEPFNFLATENNSSSNLTNVAVRFTGPTAYGTLDNLRVIIPCGNVYNPAVGTNTPTPAGATNTPTPTATNTPTLTPTGTPLPTASSTPSVTPTQLPGMGTAIPTPTPYNDGLPGPFEIPTAMANLDFDFMWEDDNINFMISIIRTVPELLSVYNLMAVVVFFAAVMFALAVMARYVSKRQDTI